LPKKSTLKIKEIQKAKKNGLFLKKSNVRFFQKQAVFFGERYAYYSGAAKRGRQPARKNAE